MAKPRKAPAPETRLDAVLLLQVVGRLTTVRLMQELWESGFADLRENDGYVFQHLVPGPIPVTELAAKLGVTQQAASNTVAELEARRYVERRADPDDARRRLVGLTDRAGKVIETTRRIRERMEAEIMGLLEPAVARRFGAALDAIVDHFGGFQVLQSRSLKPPA